MKRWISGLWSIGIVLFSASVVNAGALLEACSNIPAKADTGSGRTLAMLDCLEKLAAKVEARPEIPSGAIVAFDRSCPTQDWDLYDRAGGRFLVGAGHHANKDQNGKPLTIYQKHRLNGGEDMHKLTISELPSHKHDTVEAGEYTNSAFGRGEQKPASKARAWGNYETNLTSPVGDGVPHNNMPPYLSVYFCVKK